MTKRIGRGENGSVREMLSTPVSLGKGLGDAEKSTFSVY